MYCEFCKTYIVQYETSLKDHTKKIIVPKQIEDIISPLNTNLFLNISNAVFNASKKNAKVAIAIMKLQACNLSYERKIELYKLIDTFLLHHVINFTKKIKFFKKNESLYFYLSSFIRSGIFYLLYTYITGIINSIFLSKILSDLFISYDLFYESHQKGENKINFIKTFMKDIKTEFLNEKTTNEKSVEILQSALDQDKKIL
jgi:hypothetical protein